MFPKGESRAAWLYPLFAIGIGLLIIDAVLLAHDLNQLFVQQRRLSRAYERIEQIDGLRYRLTEAESERRAYLMTGIESHVIAHDNAVTSFLAHHAALRRLYGDEEQPLVVLADSLVTSMVDRMETPTVLYDPGRAVESATVADADSVYALMQPIRATLISLRDREQEVVDAANRSKDTSQERVIATFAITTIVALGMIALLYLFVVRDMRQRSRIERTLRQHRDDLDGRVQARTQELTEANTSLRQSIEELARSNRELEEFAYVASHDLQEPLRKLRVFSGLLLAQEADNLSDDGRHFLGRLHHAAERMSSLINDLLTYSRVRSRQEPFSPVDLNVVVREVMDDLEETLVESGATLDIGPLPTIEADAAQMRQLLHNLIGNAVKFRRPDVPCTVRVEADTVEQDGEPHHRIYVRDNGLGFEPRFSDRIFKPFQRLHAQSEYPGTGIGLAVCRRIAERHGAVLTAESRPGDGATFCLTLPAAAAAVKPKSEAALVSE